MLQAFLKAVKEYHARSDRHYTHVHIHPTLFHCLMEEVPYYAEAKTLLGFVVHVTEWVGEDEIVFYSPWTALTVRVKVPH